MSVFLVRKPRIVREDVVLEVPNCVKNGVCYLLLGIVFAIVCIILSACSESGFSRIDLNTVIGKIEVTFLVLCGLSVCAFLVKILPICAANVDLRDPPIGNSLSKQRSSSQLSIDMHNKNEGSRRGSTSSTPYYDHFANASRRPSNSSTASATPSVKIPSSPNLRVPETVENPNILIQTVDVNIDTLPSKDLMNKE